MRFLVIKKILLLLLFGSLSGQLLAQAPDTTLIRKSWFVVPILSYKQETSFGPGVAGGFYFKSRDLKKISSISYSAIYTLKNQFTFNVSPKIYVDKAHRCYLYSNVGFRNYPDVYFGRGGKYSGLSLPYTSRNAYLNLQPQYEVLDNFFVGAQCSFRYEKPIVNDSNLIVCDSVSAIYGKSGWTTYFQTGLGVTVAYDTRDNHFYPTKGLLAKLSAIYYPSVISTHAFGRFTLDYRQYQTTWVEQVLAWQVYADAAWGNVPFQYLPTLGGEDVLRGFRRNMFADDFAFALQVEYRIPLFWRLKATVFCSVGDVVSWQNPHIDKLKVGYGLGLRCRLNDARVHLRVDVAFNNFEKRPQFYIIATEAF